MLLTNKLKSKRMKLHVRAKDVRRNRKRLRFVEYPHISHLSNFAVMRNRIRREALAYPDPPDSESLSCASAIVSEPTLECSLESDISSVVATVTPTDKNAVAMITVSARKRRRLREDIISMSDPRRCHPKRSVLSATAETSIIGSVPANYFDRVEELLNGLKAEEYKFNNSLFIRRINFEETLVPIPSLYADIVKKLTVRFNLRQKADGNPRDKGNNPLTSLVNSPGTGKTATLAYFPLSEEYQLYVQMRMRCLEAESKAKITDESPVVCLLTFNSGMEGGTSSIGMRIVYGCGKCMGLIKDVHWEDFCDSYSELNTKSFTALAAVQLLRRVFGQNRLILIGVDELKNAKEDYDSVAMSELGEVLTIDGNTDLIVTALSPQYIKQLVTIYSQRRVSIVIVPPLPVGVYGLEQHRIRALAMINKVNASKPVPVSMQRILLCAPMLASGHGRSVEEFLGDIGQNWEDIENVLLSKHLTSYTLMVKLCSLQCFGYVEHPSLLAERDIILSSNAVTPDVTVFRAMLEDCKCLVYSADSEYNFKIAVTLAGLLRMINRVIMSTDDDPVSLAIKLLFPHPKQIMLEPQFDISDLWERCCDLTLVATSCEAGHLFNPYAQQSGISVQKCLQVRHARKYDLKVSSQWVADTLLIPIDGQHGYNSMISAVNTLGEQVYVYNVYKVLDAAANKETAAAAVVARKLVLMLEDHFNCRCVDHSLTLEENKERMRSHMKNIHFTLYIYDPTARVDCSIIKQKTHAELCDEVLAILRTIADESSKRAFRFVQLFGETNIYVMSQREMTEWLIPSVIPLANIVHFVGEVATPHPVVEW